jgi:hypothetical protein
MPRRSIYKFRLYVADDTTNSAQAAANLQALCKAHLSGRHEIEIVDVFKEPQRAILEASWRHWDWILTFYEPQITAAGHPVARGVFEAKYLGAPALSQ